MPLPTQAQHLRDTTLELKILPVDEFGATLRTVSPAIITVGTAAVAGATSIQLSAAADITIRAGSSLSFVASAPTGKYGRQQVLFTEGADITDTPASFTVSPLYRAIAASSTAEVFEGMLPLAGVTVADMSNQETQVDSTDFMSQTGTEAELIRVARTFAVSLNHRVGDECLENIVKPVGSFDSALFGREVYSIITLPDGEQFKGAAKLMGLNLPMNQNEIKKATFSLMYQGMSFVHVRPYEFA